MTDCIKPRNTLVTGLEANSAKAMRWKNTIHGSLAHNEVSPINHPLSEVFLSMDSTKVQSKLSERYACNTRKIRASKRATGERMQPTKSFADSFLSHAAPAVDTACRRIASSYLQREKECNLPMGATRGPDHYMDSWMTSLEVNCAKAERFDEAIGCQPVSKLVPAPRFKNCELNVCLCDWLRPRTHEVVMSFSTNSLVPQQAVLYSLC